MHLFALRGRERCKDEIMGEGSWVLTQMLKIQRDKICTREKN